jgi:hypothetical protein
MDAVGLDLCETRLDGFEPTQDARRIFGPDEPGRDANRRSPRSIPAAPRSSRDRNGDAAHHRRRCRAVARLPAPYLEAQGEPVNVAAAVMRRLLVPFDALARAATLGRPTVRRPEQRLRNRWFP